MGICTNAEWCALGLYNINAESISDVCGSPSSGFAAEFNLIFSLRANVCDFSQITDAHVWPLISALYKEGNSNRTRS